MADTPAAEPTEPAPKFPDPYHSPVDLSPPEGELESEIAVDPVTHEPLPEPDPNAPAPEEETTVPTDGESSADGAEVNTPSPETTSASTETTPETVVEEDPTPAAEPSESEVAAPTASSNSPSSDESPSQVSSPDQVPTALDPRTWPDKDKGTVTDPAILKANGLDTTPPPPPAPALTPIGPEGLTPPATLPDGGEWFQCLYKDGRVNPNCAVFYTAQHLSGQSLQCPTCGGSHIGRL